ECNEPVERGNFALYTAAPCDVDNAETRGVENVARNDDIRAPKEHHRVAVCVCRGLMQDLNTFTVEVHVFSRLLKRFRRQRSDTKRRCLAVRRAHPAQHPFERQNRCPTTEKVGADTGSTALQKKCLAGFGDRLITAKVIRIKVGVDHTADWEWCDFVDGRNDRGSARY